MRIEASDIEGLRPVLWEFAREISAELQAQAARTSGHDDGRLAYSEPEAAAKLGVEPHVLREQRRLGKIQFCRGPGRRILYRPTHLAAYLDQSESSIGTDGRPA